MDSCSLRVESWLLYECEMNSTHHRDVCTLVFSSSGGAPQGVTTKLPAAIIDARFLKEKERKGKPAGASRRTKEKEN